MTAGRQPRRFAPLAVLGLLVASLGLNGYLGHAALDYYELAVASRLDPAGLKKYDAERAKPVPGGPLIVFFGDSRALMWPPPTGLTGYVIVNRGVGNQTTAQMLLRLEADVTELHPAVVVFEGGVNDLKVIADFAGRRAEIVADCEANLERIVARCRQSGATVVLLTVFDIGDVALWRRPFWSGDVASAVADVNAFLPRLAGEKVILFDANQVLADDRGKIQAPYQLDYLHLSRAGYDALDKKVVPLLSALPR
ncbi:MAG: SGNH/GDSL hydrolase family protein [Polyangiaceae bacterium]|jgi:lysophospholipase L1-like esterase